MIGSAATDEKDRGRTITLSSPAGGAEPAAGQSPPPIRLIALENSSPDPPYRPARITLGRNGQRANQPLLFRRRTAGSLWSIIGAGAETEIASEEEPSAEGEAIRFGDDSDDGESDEFEFDDAPFEESDVGEEGLAEHRISFRDDACGLFPMLYNDVLSCVTWPNAIILGAAAGGAIAIREHLDGDVREYTAQRPLRWDEGSQVLRQFGEFSYQVPVIAAIYGLGLWTQDEHTHEFSKALISAYSISAITVVAIKGVTNTNRPTDEFQDGEYGFPSYHAASSFSIAAVVDEYYGWPVGLPCYVLAGLVGWSRIDQREHDLSDVVFGSILGFVIGKSVAAAHQDGITGVQVVPCYDPATRSFGAVFHKRF